MAMVTLDEEKLKGLLKSALVEALEEQRGLMREIIEEALEDIALARAVEEGLGSGSASREEIFVILESAS